MKKANPNGPDVFFGWIFTKKQQPGNHSVIASEFATGGPDSVRYVRDFQKGKVEMRRTP
jgi:hypothetical protein